MMSRFFLFLFLSLIALTAHCQPNATYPKNYFRFPLSIPPFIVANFGALRTNHYHMGLDLRTQQRENLAVSAVADGYVSHIRVGAYGYGRAIYITHPNGYTTVYAHLNAFYAELETFLHNQQYATQSWEQDIDFSPAQFPVHKGQFIAWSGNTGSSEGPHLHFEIRDSGLENGHNRNPLLFDLNIPDHVSPTISRLSVFNRNQSIYENSPRAFPLQKKAISGESFYAPATVVKVPYGKFSFGIGMQDKTDNSFPLGIYKADLYVDDSLRSGFRVEECLYDDTRYINAGIDFFSKYNGGSLVQLLSRLPGNKGPFYDTTAGDGLLQLDDDSIHKAEVEVSDGKGNVSRLRFSIQRDSSLSFPHNNISGTIVQKLSPNEASTFKTESVEIKLDASALYDTMFLRYKTDVPPAGAVSSRHSIGDYRLPIHTPYSVSIKTNIQLPDSMKKKVVMILQSGKKRDAQQCSWQQDWATANWQNFGQLYLKIDTIAPMLRPTNVHDNATFVKDQKLVFDAQDETSDLQSFNGYIDGHWVIFRQKNNRYTYDFDEHCPPGEHTLEIKATDLASNEAEYRCTFINGAKE